MPYVLDASVTAAWLLPDEDDAFADGCRLRLEHEHAIVPAIWWYEIRNLLLMAERRGRMNAATTATALNIIDALPIVLDEEADGALIVAVARDHDLSVYDAAYVELALRARLPLATLDPRLADAARSAGIMTLD